MKSKIFMVSMALFSGLFTASGAERNIVKIWNDPGPLLKEIRTQIENRNRNHEEDKALAGNIKTLAYAISVELNAAESPDWATPSAERKAVIQKWADTLAPETQKLVDLAFGQGFGKTRSSVQARSLLDYAAPTEDFAEQIRKYLREGQGGADLLYEHRLLTDADKEVMRQLRPVEDRERDLENWAIGLSAFGMLDGLDIAKKALSKKPQGETPEEITRTYLRFLRMANYLGPDAAVFLPEIEALISDSAIISSGYLNHFEYARDVISGKQPRQGRYAVNGSGPLSLWLKSENLEKPESRVPVSKSSPELKKPTEQEPKLTTETEESPQPTRWALVAVVILAALGLLWVLLRKRK